MKKLLVVFGLICLGTGLAQGADCGGAVVCACGDTVTSSTTLLADLTCAGPGLIIDANNVNVDLNGFTLTGTVITLANAGVDNSAGFNGMKVKNGTIVGFGSAVRVYSDANRVQLNHLIISGDREYHAIDMKDSRRVDIKHSSITVTIESSDFWFVEAIRLESIDPVTVHNVDVHGGFIGVNFACGDCDDQGELPTNGVVKESTFTGNIIGILIANSTDALVKGNHVSGSVNQTAPFAIGSKGISVDSDFHVMGSVGLSVSGVELKDNHVHDNEGIGIRLLAVATTTTSDILVEDNLVYDNGSEGILLVDTDDSEIKGNLVNDNGVDGIALTVGSTGNDITDNGATGNTVDDMFHDGGSVGNFWVDNTCGASTGGEIDCP